MVLPALLLALLPCGARPLLAQPSPQRGEERLSPAFGQCVEASGGVTAALRDCAGQEYGRLDLKLNAGYRATMARLPDEDARSRLRQLEREWLKARWSACDREVEQSGTAGGTAALLIHDTCRLAVMAQRILWLERYQP